MTRPRACEGSLTDLRFRAHHRHLHESMCPRCCCRPQASSYCKACGNGDMATLRCLRRLGCPWGCTSTFNCVIPHADLEALRCMVAEGCPVDWHKACSIAKDRKVLRSEAAKILQWVTEMAATADDSQSHPSDGCSRVTVAAE